MAPLSAESAAKAIQARLPDAYRLEWTSDGLLAARRELWDELAAAGFRLGGRNEWPSSELAGRHPLGEIALAGERLLVRGFRHGGLLRWLTGERFADPRRPFDELVLANELADKGVLTPELVAARAQRHDALGWRLELVSRLQGGTRDGAELLEAIRRAELAPGERVASMFALGATVGRLHVCAFVHADLHPRNLLVEREPPVGTRPRVWVLDLDRSRFVERLDERTRRDNLARLLRAVLRRERRAEPFLRAADIRTFFRGYGEHWQRPDWCWREDWREIARSAARREPWHRLGWAAEGLFGGGPEKRDGRARVH
jgi:3-deoxy-D-manno-octulosonic acid kinase